MSARVLEAAAPSRAVDDARRALGVDCLALAIHDASLPGDPTEDLGRGAPGSAASLRLAAFLRGQGFDALQLGPQTWTDEGDPSPYLGALFSRNFLSIAPGPLADPECGDLGGWLPPRRLASLAASRPAGAERRMPYSSVFRSQRMALGAAFESFERARAAGEDRARALEARIGSFVRESAAWLESDALYESLRAEHGGRDWMHWTGPRAELDRRVGDPEAREPEVEARRAELARRHAPALRFYRFVQTLAHGQHARFRRATAGLGLRLFGDLHIGASARDTWRLPGLFLGDYRLGAPPSRTNQEGQPWDYPVLDPEAYEAAEGGPGPARRFVRGRMEKMFAEYDGVRIDHPQGRVCPWVYRADDPDPLHAVQHGARLFSSPGLADHPALARHAIPRPEQLAADGATPRYADDWVRDLDDGQEERYARLFDVLARVAAERGQGSPRLVCEVLSTLPFPLARVLARHGLGRFRVTQKADPLDPEDVYRPERARPEDWIMFGNHDTPPLWERLATWREEGRVEARAAWMAERLEPTGSARESFRGRLLAEPGLLAHAELAQLFLSPARHVSVFFADLFGISEIYNRPGIVHPENWTLRLGPDWAEAWERGRAEDRVLCPALALWLALRASPGAGSPELRRGLRQEAERGRRGAPLPE